MVEINNLIFGAIITVAMLIISVPINSSYAEQEGELEVLALPA